MLESPVDWRSGTDNTRTFDSFVHVGTRLVMLLYTPGCMKSILQIFDKGLMQSRDIHNGTLLG